MTAKDLYQAGKLKEAIQALNVEVRDNPSDVRRRTFLFELLTFAGEYDRAQKQLQVLASESGEAQLGTVLYLSALHAEKTRKETFAKGDYPTHAGDGTAPDVTGVLNKKPFASVVDADPRIGPRLESSTSKRLSACRPSACAISFGFPPSSAPGLRSKRWNSVRSCCPCSRGMPA
ncbi:MAG: hypothetical protein NTV52_10855 [Acidobacteria bacterium]|nr:hypothetical protein [Acidobacteriota bacterium]